MRISHKELKRKINQEKLNISDKQLFMSHAFSSYLTDMAETVTGRYKRKIKVHVFYDEAENAKIAYTDNNYIFINVGNIITKTFPTRQLKADSLIGMNAHEIGHILFTDFLLAENYYSEMSNGRIYPFEPTFTDAKHIDALNEIKDVLSKRNTPKSKGLIMIAHQLFNVIEDGYIEARMCDAFPGKYGNGIILNNIRMSEIVPSISEQIAKGVYPFSIFMNLLIQYHRSGDINNRDNYTGEILDLFYEVLPILDDAIYEDDSKKRYNAVNVIIVMAWEYIKDILDKASNNISQDKEEFLSKIEKDLGEQLSICASEPKGTTTAIKDKSSFKAKKENAKEERNRVQEVLSEETSRLEVLKTEEFSDNKTGGIEWNKSYSGSGYNNAGSDIQRIIKNVAEENIQYELNNSLTEELEEEADKINLGDAHEGIHIVINRIKNVEDCMIEEYKMIAPPLIAISKQIQKRLKRILKDTSFSEKQTGLLMGRRIEPRLLTDKDCKFFSKNKLPNITKNLSVALLVDESGSMSGKDRATYARASAIMVYDFCKSMDIPVSIIGHTEEYSVELYAYTDFNSKDDKDRFRLMDISARGSNRDGAALRYVAERLLKQPEKSKLLMLISDGQPAGSYGYYGTVAEADLREIVKEYKNKGIMFVAAAIGDDKENIERIYGDAFLDITDLSKLPFLLVKRIEKEIRS